MKGRIVLILMAAIVGIFSISALSAEGFLVPGAAMGRERKAPEAAAVARV